MREPALVNRTGAFADSVKVVDVIQTPKGHTMLLAGLECLGHAPLPLRRAAIVLLGRRRLFMRRLPGAQPVAGRGQDRAVTMQVFFRDQVPGYKLGQMPVAGRAQGAKATVKVERDARLRTGHPA